jgi:hypothetical protein
MPSTSGKDGDPFKQVLSSALLAKIRQRRKQESHGGDNGGVQLPPVKGATATEGGGGAAVKRMSTPEARRLVEEKLERDQQRRDKEKLAKERRRKQVSKMKLRAIHTHDERFNVATSPAKGDGAGNKQSEQPHAHQVPAERKQQQQQQQLSPKKKKDSAASSTAGGSHHRRLSSLGSELEEGDPEMQYILFNDVHPHHVQAGLRMLEMPRTKCVECAATAGSYLQIVCRRQPCSVLFPRCSRHTGRRCVMLTLSLRQELRVAPSIASPRTTGLNE